MAKTSPAADKSARMVDLPLTRHQRHFMDSPPHGCAVGRFAGSTWVTRYGIEYTVSSQGFWQEIWARLQQATDAAGSNLTGRYIDSTIVRALISRQREGTESGTTIAQCRQMQQQERWDAQKAASAPKFTSERHGQTDTVCLDGLTQRSQKSSHHSMPLVKRTGQGKTSASR